jgi:hypothetical protein
MVWCAHLAESNGGAVDAGATPYDSARLWGPQRWAQPQRMGSVLNTF